MTALAFLAGETTYLAYLWRLARADGVVLGFTSHDRAIVRDGLRYEARPGMTPSAITIEDGFRPDGMSIEGALSDAGLRARDLDAGRWFGAAIELSACDWREPERDWLRLATGTIGEVVRRERGGDGSFQVELLSEMAVLGRDARPRCSAMCRASLGDARCQVDMEGRAAVVEIVEIAEDHLLLDAPPANPERCSWGRIRLLDGQHCGLDRPLADIDGVRVNLLEAIEPLGVGSWRARLSEGCDRRFATCVDRFGNGAQFDGEPHVPGTDALMRYGDG
jgi:uncharacterized phage protein (TIGR02218 family)